ncbi:MAG TPA: hypothetical protein DCL66_13160 [Gammaproteobacteria bacterium]|nr:hypothetical protein [Gammaproteobacteria bacterium]
MSPNRIVWLNTIGSGNEKTAHLAQNTRMKIMFFAFDGNPKILRLCANVTVTHSRDETWQELENLFESHPSSRQCADFRFDFLQTS